MADDGANNSDDLVNVRIPTQLKKSQKRKQIRTEFDDETLDQSVLDAQRRERERLERLDKIRQQTSDDHITQMEALMMPSSSTTLPQLDIQLSDFDITANEEFNLEAEQKYFGGHLMFEDRKVNIEYSPDVPSTSSAPVEVIDLSSDSDDDIAVTGVVQSTRLFTGRRNRWVNADKDREEALQMEKEYSREQARIKKMRDLATLESTEKYCGRLLVNSGHPEEDSDIFVAPHLTHTLQPHQLGGIRFMYDNTIESMHDYDPTSGLGCILAHSMGLGKTIQVITFSEIFLRATKSRKILIIMPINTIQNWYSEYDRWMPKYNEKGEVIRNFEVFLLGDAVKSFDQRVNLIEEWHKKGGVLLMGYDMFRLLIRGTQPKKMKKKRPKLNMNGVNGYEQMFEPDEIEVEVPENEFTSDGRIKIEANNLITEALLDPGPELVICDEGHKIKNLNTDIAISLGAIATKRRIVLTGYPLQNNLVEYFCMIDFVRPKFLGNKKAFSERFEKPIKNGQCTDSTEADIKFARQRTHVLVELVKGFVQRRTHLLLKSILPESKEFVILLRKSVIQRLLYRCFVLFAKSEMKNGQCATFNPLKAFAVCSKIWNHPDVLCNTMEHIARNEQAADERKTAEFQRQIQMNNNPLMNHFPKLPVWGNGQQTMAEKEANVMEYLQRHADPNYPPIQSPFSSLPSISSNSPASALYNEPSTSSTTTTPTKNRKRPRKNKKNGDLLDEDEESTGSIKYDWAKETMLNYIKGNIENSYKMLISLEIIDECTKIDDKILLFSQNLTALSSIEEYMSKRKVLTRENPTGVERWEKNRNYLRLDGSTSGVDREKLINRFNSEPNLRVFLISTRAGSLGINLVSANRCIIFDACWNPCHDAQAVCRIYRYGQQKKTYIYRMIMDNSMEKAIFNRQISKHGLQQQVVDDAQVNANITQKELETLLVYDEALDVRHDAWDTSDWDFGDELLDKICKKYSHLMAEKPFLHESLILESDKQLSEEEKKEAQLLFEREKRGELYPEESDMFMNRGGSLGFSNQHPQYGSLMLPRGYGIQPPQPQQFFDGPPPMRSTPMAQRIVMNNETHYIMNLHQMSQQQHQHQQQQQQQQQPTAAAHQPIQLSTPFPGASKCRKPVVNNSGFVQEILTDRANLLPVVGRRHEIRPVPSGTIVQLVKPKLGTYIKTVNNEILDASGTIYETYADNLVEQIRLQPEHFQAAPQQPRGEPEVIDLD
ncbi:unnamed protein product [Caenorhabditis angaria]|uniref:Uncharacterized protein n=1 Tax=Caenorhabditis angaria TaxID=860376 RepID=A0A9P1IRP1_9PELO|nr:unnamed protein product [Caenorhabditis angaria]